MKRRVWRLALGGLGLLALAPLTPTAPRPAPGDFGLSPARPRGGTYIPAAQLGSSDYCATCHTAIYQQWTASAHHFSSFNNPFYRRVALDTRRTRGRTAATFCAGCHDPVPLMSGELDGMDLRGWSANAGITCLSCHLIQSVHGGNGGYEIAPSFLDATLISASDLARTVHDGFVRAVPWLHRRALSRGLYAEAEYCAACHTVTVPKEVNGAAAVAVQTDHADWLQSRFAHPGGPAARRCADCHMPLERADDPAAHDGFVRSHRFPGGNTALPALNRDGEQLAAAERFLAEGAPRLELEAGRELDGWRLRLTVENDRVGHGFPGGTAESNEAWLAVRVQDARGRSLLSVGEVDGAGRVDPGAYRFRTIHRDREGRPTGRRNTSTEAVATEAGTRLAPGERRELSYAFAVPANAAFPLQASAGLQWRKFGPEFTEWVFEGKPVPVLPITVLRKAAVEVRGGER